MTYYAYKQAVGSDGKVTTTNKTGDKAAMEYQYYLFCASCSKNEAGDVFDAVEWGTVEGGKLERKTWNHGVNA